MIKSVNEPFKTSFESVTKKRLLVVCAALLLPVQSGLAQTTLLSRLDTPEALSSYEPAAQPETTSGVSLKLSGWPLLTSLDLTETPTDVWSSMRKGFSIPEVDSPKVQDQERVYKKNKRMLRTMLTRSEPYIYYIVQECEKRSLPAELALIPFIESQFNPHARSGAAAEGLWQFIPSTGRHFELKQNKWIDERRDLVASTRAALDYLTYLYDMHGDWHLALISYNWGEGSVTRAIRKAKDAGLEPTLNNLELPEETAAYIPKLQALKNIIETPDRFGMSLPKVPNTPYFVEIKRKKDVDLREIARQSGLKLEELRKLNPALKQPVLYAAHTDVLLVPADQAQAIRKSLVDYKSPARARRYKVNKGDTLGGIAAKMNVSTKDILALNNLSKKSVIKPGMVLTLPAPAVDEDWNS